MRTQRLPRIAVATFLGLLLPAAAGAQTDNTPPVLQSFSLSSNVVDVSSGPQSVVVTVRVTDDLAGVAGGGVYFVSPSGLHQWGGSIYEGQYDPGGSPLDGVYHATITFPQFIEAGVYHVTSFWAYDKVQNWHWYTEQQLSDLGYPTTIQVVANEPPIAEAGANRAVLVGEAVTFDGSASVDPDGSITGWQWNFGDSATGTGEVVTHTYVAPGQFIVVLTVTDDAGATATDSTLVTVQTPSQAITALSALVVSYNINHGIANSLETKLQNVAAALQAANANQRRDAANKLGAFINAVEAQRGKALTNAQADALESMARRILAVL